MIFCKVVIYWCKHWNPVVECLTLLVANFVGIIWMKIYGFFFYLQKNSQIGEKKVMRLINVFFKCITCIYTCMCCELPL